MTNNTTEPVLTDEQILDFFSAAGVELNATPNMLYTVRGQHAQLVKAARALLTSPRAAVPLQLTDSEKASIDRLTAIACSFPEHIGPSGAWSRVNHGDLGAVVSIAKRALDAAPAAPVADEWDASQQAYIESLDEPDQAVAEAEPIDKLEPTLILTGAQLLEALDLVAPDRTADQFESEVSFQYGNGHSGKGMYCWITDYPDEGASLLDGTTVATQAPAAPVAFASPAFSEDQIAEIARKCELESHACPGSTMFMCAEMAVEETLEAISKQSKRLSVAAIYKALNEFELVCENNDVRRLTNDEKYAAQEFVLSLIHAAPAAPVVALSEDDAANLITIDRRDLYGFVRGSIKRALEDASHGAADSHEPMSAVDCWSEAHTRTIEIFDSMKIAGIGEPVAKPVCSTCNGHGMIGGPSFYAPDEGGVPCPDCAQAVAADGASTDQRMQFFEWASSNGYTEYHDSMCAAWEKATRRAAVSPATADTTWKAPKQHCQNGGDVCLAGNRDGVACPEDSCDIDDGTRKNPAALPIKIPHVHIRPEDEEIGRQYYALGFVDGSRSITDAPATADRICTLIPLSERHPVPDEHPRVIAFTDGSDFNGAQFFDVPADSLNECFYESPDEQPEVCRHATHWMPRPSLRHAAPATANERAANPIKTTERDHSFIDNDLDFEPDAQHAVADMANIGYALMQTIERMAPGYCWNESPTEIVSDLINERDEARASQAAAPAEAREPHADDVAVDEFAIEMKAKMAAARAKGRSGWETCAPADLSRMLREHVEKGDPRDVANFCMMLHHHGAHISASAEARLPSAWVTPENDRAITQSQKQGMLRDGGASASSVRPYSIACYAGSAPADAGEAVASDVTYDDVVSACDAHGITLPVDAIEPAVELINHFGRRAQGAQGGKGGEA
ncbi:hypothetical protein [Burkholderia gladioli]|uniref:hypothetical protein n=1 Tax=Burkholderia gladioli TaxID=28095 RepID=UPI00163EE978|nr:hypothetical protein [Burkholderia gladioli]